MPIETLDTEWRINQSEIKVVCNAERFTGRLATAISNRSRKAFLKHHGSEKMRVYGVKAVAITGLYHNMDRTGLN